MSNPTPEDMLRYAAGQCDPETTMQLLVQLEDPRSEATRFVDEMAGLAHQGLQVDWNTMTGAGNLDK